MNKRGITAMISGAVLILAALSLIIYNSWDEKRALTSVETLLPKIEQIIESNANNSPSQNQEEANTGMDTVTVDGNKFIGVIELPSVNIQLPVLASWSYPLLKISPCRYSGDVKSGAFVIAGHNYTRQFGKLGNLGKGDKVYFTDVHGHVYKYTVEETTELQKTQIKEMNGSKWDLTLFTCDYSGRLRITVRCMLNN